MRGLARFPSRRIGRAFRFVGERTFLCDRTIRKLQLRRSTPIIANGTLVMLEAGWLQIVSRIGVENLDNVSLITVTGNELVIQSVFRIEHDFMVIRARTSGTMDTGRCIVLPYAQVDFLAFNKAMSEEQVQKLFDGPFQASVPAMMMSPSSVPVSTPTPLPYMPAPRSVTPSSEAQAPAAVEEATPASDTNKHVSKSLLLARLRERLAEKSK
jgi:hypothetical protein